ncbi:MAG: histidinol-phosphate transaminase [Actinomycetes bacterium]
MTAPDDLPIRPELRGVSAYGAPQLDVPVRLNTNENPHSPGPIVAAAIAEAIAAETLGLQRYPDRDAVALRTDLADYLSHSTGAVVAPEQVWAANGSNEILQQLLQLFAGPGRTVLGFEPSYSMHPLIARGTGSTFIAASRTADFGIDLAAAVGTITELRPDVVFLCSPNNPTGTALELAAVEQIYAAIAAGPAGVLIVDEAYAEFSTRASAIALLPDRPRLIVTRTMSKAFAFAGARVGYLAADPAVVEAIARVRLPYHLSSLTQAAARAAVAHAAELQAGVEDLKIQRDRIVEQCLAMGCRVAASDANFVLIGGFGDQTVIWRALVDRGVLVRDVGLAGWLRVTAGTEVETTAFLTALSAVLDEVGIIGQSPPPTSQER